jgi:hypothetical protein
VRGKDKSVDGERRKEVSRAEEKKNEGRRGFLG